MSKIDDYIKAKKYAERIRAFADSVDDPKRADKFGAKITITDTFLGYYGNSSAYSWGDDETAEIEKEIERRLRSLAENAAQRVEADAEVARKAAQAEAREVLIETEETT